MTVDDRNRDNWSRQLQERGRALENAQDLKGSGGGGTFDGMDPWQTSVEKRLDSLDGRLGRVEGDLGQLKIDVATLVERVAHLPSKGFVWAAMGTVGTVIVAAIGVLGQLGVLAK
jgi:hypothetical protein